MESAYGNETPEMKFKVGVHSEITKAANDGILNSKQLGLVIWYNILQDSHQTQSCIHFDNCAFAEGLDYIGGEWDLVEASSDKYSDVALAAFGRLLHTVQDFYAHSNWIELHQDADPIPVWDLNLGSLPSDIVSGTWFLGRPKKCPSGAPTHGELNKDDSNSKEGKKEVGSGPNKGKTLYELAFDAAVRASRTQFDRFKATRVSSKLKSSGKKLVSSEGLGADVDADILSSLIQETMQLKGGS